MNRRLTLTLILAAVILQPAHIIRAQSSASDLTSSLRQPLVFEQNAGQFPTNIAFGARGANAAAWLDSGGIIMALKQAPGRSSADTLRLRWGGGHPSPTLSGEQPMPGRVNYLKGRDSSQWQTDIKTFAQVRYQDVYPGVDAVVYSRDGQIEYDFLLAPGADPAAIRLEFHRADGTPADVVITPEGELIVALESGEFRQRPPMATQEDSTQTHQIPVRFAFIATGVIGFQVEKADPALPLRIDPVVTYGTYLGGTGNEFGTRVAVDANGFIYVTGNTNSTDFFVQAPLKNNGDANGDIFITKFAPNAQTILWSTYLGGTLGDFVENIQLRPEGVFISGYSESPDFPGTAQGFQPNLAGDYDAIIAQISHDGQQVLSATYFGGAQNYENALDLVVDDKLNVYIAGQTLSNDLPTSRPLPQLGTYQGGTADAYVAVFRDAGRGLLFSTYLGGANADQAFGLDVDANGNIHVAGMTESALDFPLINAFQPDYGGGFSDAFFTIINPITPQLVFSTFLGGSGTDAAMTLDLSPGGRPVLTGNTASALFPVQNPLPGAAGNSTDIFISVFETNGSDLFFSTRLGGNSNENVRHAAIDPAGFIYATGWTFSEDFPTTNAYQATAPGISLPDSYTDAFVVKVDPTTPRLAYATYLGGEARDVGYGLAVDGQRRIWVAGETSSPDFPVFMAWQPELSDVAFADAFVARLTELPVSPVFGPPRVVRSIYFDIGQDQIVEENDPLTLIFDRPIRINEHLLDGGSVYLPVADDTLGGAGDAQAGAKPEGVIALPGDPTFQVNPLNQRQLLIRLGGDPVLNPGGDFTPTQTTPGSPSGIDIAANLPPTAITSLYGVPAQKNPDILAVDMRWNIRQEGYFIDEPSTDTLVLPPNTANAAYSRHRLIFPPNSISQTQVLLRPTGKDPRITSSMEIEVTGQTTFDPPATLRLQYLPAEVDRDAGQTERGMRIHQLVRLPNDEPAWVPVPGVQRVDLDNKWVEVELENLNPTGMTPFHSSGATGVEGPSQVGTFGNIAGETIESNSFFIKPVASEAIAFLNTPVLTPGANGYYTQHAIEFPGYIETTPDDPDGIKVTMRKPGLFDFIPADGGQEWPIESAAFMIVETVDFFGAAYQFTDPVNMVVQFFDGTSNTFNDIWDFTNQPGDPQGMRLARDVFDGFGVDSQFTGNVINEVTLSPGGGTTSANGAIDLTDSEGVGLWGVVAGEPVVSIRHGWMLK